MNAAEFEKHQQLEAHHRWFEGRRRCILDGAQGRFLSRTRLPVGVSLIAVAERS